jgi:glycosyltransferase involved in cell wall biosynthesis
MAGVLNKESETSMRILFASLAPPYPPNNGQRMRNWSILKALAAEGAQVTLVSFGEPGERIPNALGEVCERVQLITKPREPAGWRSYLLRLRALFLTHPYGTLRYQSAEMKAAVESLANRQAFDAVICDDIYQFKNLPGSVHDRILLNKHDFTFVIVQRLLARTLNPLKLAYGWLECRKLRRWEFAVCSQVAGVMVCSELDGEILRAAVPAAQIFIVPNVIDVEGYQPRDDHNGRTLLFFGALDYFANQDAVHFFVSEILPLVKKENPDVEFVVAGRNPPESFRKRYANVQGIRLTGTIKNMQEAIAQATVCVVPLRIGSGTRLKILEAGAMKKPVVSTRLGAEGLALADGTDIFLADKPQDFARAICKLLREPARCHALGQAARRQVEQHYSLAALRRTLRSLLAKVGRKTPANELGQVMPMSTGRGVA